MQVQFLGTGGFHPNERRHTASILLPELRLAFDAGTSLFRLPSRLKTDTLDLLLTHAHLDHICGLTYLLVPLLRQQIRRCRVHGRPQDLAAIREHLFADPVFPVLPTFELVSLAETIRIPGGRITHCPLHHPGGSIGYRIDLDAGRSLAYITDTTTSDSYFDFIRGVDVLIHECYFPDEHRQWCEQTGHSHTSAVAELARSAKVGRLYLTHIDPQRPEDDPIGLEGARAIFPETSLAEDLLEFTW